jgi:hypothetical protein
MFSALVSGCNKDREMHEPKEKTPGDLAVLEEQIDPNERGKEAIQITEDILFPGSEPYEGAKYDFLADESPAKVAHWYEVNLEGCEVKKISGNKPENAKWEITLDDLIIDVVPGPGEDNTLIRYKKDIHYKKQSE